MKIGQNSRGAKIRKNQYGKDYYGFIRETSAPAVIVECAFVDNEKDIQIIDTDVEKERMGEAIAKGILKSSDIAYIASDRENKPLYRVQVGAYTVKANAEDMKKKLKAKGFESFITT